MNYSKSIIKTNIKVFESLIEWYKYYQINPHVFEEEFGYFFDKKFVDNEIKVIMGTIFNRKIELFNEIINYYTIEDNFNLYLFLDDYNLIYNTFKKDLLT